MLADFNLIFGSWWWRLKNTFSCIHSFLPLFKYNQEKSKKKTLLRILYAAAFSKNWLIHIILCAMCNSQKHYLITMSQRIFALTDVDTKVYLSDLFRFRHDAVVTLIVEITFNSLHPLLISLSISYTLRTKGFSGT